MMSYVLLWFGIGSITFHLISGLTLTSDSSILYTTGFTLVCDVQGTITTSLTINDPGGNPAIQCFSPPGGCGSAVSNTYNRDVAAGTLTVNIIQSNVNTTASVGNWICTDGISSAPYQVQEIVSFREPIIQAASADDGATVTVKFECIYPYPDEIKIEYVKEGDRSSVLKTETGVMFTNGTASNCPVADARAISVEGTFTLSHSGLAESAVIRAAVSFSGSVSPFGYSTFTIATTNGKGSLFLHAFLPVFLIVLIGINIFFGLTWCVCKDGPFKQGSMKRCCPSNIVCNVVCPMCTKPKAICSCCSGFSFIVQCAISVVVFLIVAAIIGVIIAFGLGLESGKDDLALGLSIVFGVVLVVIYIISVYPRLAYAPNERENGGNCVKTSRIGIMEETKEPEDLPVRVATGSSDVSASEVRFTTERRSPRPLPAIGSEAKQLPPISYEESTLKKKPLNATLPEIPKSNKLPPVDTVNNEEDRPKRRKKKKKRREEEENEEEDKRDSQNSGGQANVEEED